MLPSARGTPYRLAPTPPAGLSGQDRMRSSAASIRSWGAYRLGNSSFEMHCEAICVPTLGGPLPKRTPRLPKARRGKNEFRAWRTPYSLDLRLIPATDPAPGPRYILRLLGVCLLYLCECRAQNHV